MYSTTLSHHLMFVFLYISASYQDSVYPNPSLVDTEDQGDALIEVNTSCIKLVIMAVECVHVQFLVQVLYQIQDHTNPSTAVTADM